MAVRTLRKGCKGEDVRVIQRALNRNGAGIDADGDFGNQTRDAVIAFQQKQRAQNPQFAVDGEVGKQTRRALFPLIAVTVNVYGTRLSSPGNGSRQQNVNIGFGVPLSNSTFPRRHRCCRS